MSSLVVEITEPSTEYLKDLGDTEEDGDDGEGVHGAEEDGLLKVFGHHALGHVEGLFQGARVTHVQRVDLVKTRTGRGAIRWLAEGFTAPGWNRGCPETSTNLKAKEVALQPEGNDFQDDAQKNRNDVEDGVDGPLQNLLLVNVLTGCVEVEHGSRNQHRD